MRCAQSANEPRAWHAVAAFNSSLQKHSADLLCRVFCVLYVAYSRAFKVHSQKCSSSNSATRARAMLVGMAMFVPHAVGMRKYKFGATK